MATYRKHEIASEGAAIDNVFGPVTSAVCLEQITAHFSAAPSTAGTLSIVRESASGSAHDTTIYSIDPSTASTVNIAIMPASLGLLLMPGDALRTTYANPNARTIGIQYVLR